MRRYDANGVPDGCATEVPSQNGLSVCIDYWWTIPAGNSVYLADTPYGSFEYAAMIDVYKEYTWPRPGSGPTELHTLDWQNCTAPGGDCLVWGIVSFTVYSSCSTISAKIICEIVACNILDDGVVLHRAPRASLTHPPNTLPVAATSAHATQDQPPRAVVQRLGRDRR